MTVEIRAPDCIIAGLCASATAGNLLFGRHREATDEFDAVKKGSLPRASERPVSAEPSNTFNIRETTKTKCFIQQKDSSKRRRKKGTLFALGEKIFAKSQIVEGGGR